MVTWRPSQISPDPKKEITPKNKIEALWRTKLLPASFRNVSFYVEEIEDAGGRRLAIHEYPGQDKPFAEDLGRTSRKFSVTGYIVGPDYFAQRDSLRDALEQRGEGVLVHPYGGKKSVAVLDYSMTQSPRYGGMVNFTISFVEAGEAKFPDLDIDHESIIETKALSTIDRIRAWFEEKYDASGIGYIATEIRADVEAGMRMVQKATKFITRSASYVNEIQSQISGLPDSIASAANLHSSIYQVVNGIKNLSSADNYLAPWRASLEVLKYGKNKDADDVSVYGGGLTDFQVTTSNRERQEVDRLAVIAQFREIALVTAAEAAVGLEFLSYTDAAFVRDALGDAFDEVLLGMGNDDDDKYEALDDLRASIIKAINAKGATLARIIEFRVISGVTSTLTLSYDRYQDIGREQEIIDRNNVIRNPAFVPGDTSLELLNE